MKKSYLLSALFLSTFFQTSTFAVESLSKYSTRMKESSTTRVELEATLQLGKLTVVCPVAMYSVFTAYVLNSIPIVGFLANATSSNVFNEEWSALSKDGKDSKLGAGAPGGALMLGWETFIDNSIAIMKNQDVHYPGTEHAYFAALNAEKAFLGTSSGCQQTYKKSLIALKELASRM